jgi:hypothetical protein
MSLQFLGFARCRSHQHGWHRPAQRTRQERTATEAQRQIRTLTRKAYGIGKRPSATELRRIAALVLFANERSQSGHRFHPRESRATGAMLFGHGPI